MQQEHHAILTSQMRYIHSVFYQFEIESLSLIFIRLFQQLTSKEGDLNGEERAVCTSLSGTAMVVWLT